MIANAIWNYKQKKRKDNEKGRNIKKGKGE